MRRNNKQVTTYFILFSLLLIGVVYAILQANLQINGVAKIQANTWDIHFNNIQVNSNSVPIGTGDSAATIDSENNCKVDFEVTLSIPGDFYEFTIDVVNAGTIDGMIGTLNKTLKVNNEVVEETPDYLDYSVTYSDGVEIEENHKITAGTTETYLVRLEFKADIEELPQATTITTSLEPQYLQADSSSAIRPKLLYGVFKAEMDNDSGLVHEYTGEHKDSFTINGNEKIYHWYASNESNADIILQKWNVYFGGFCWQAYRTTDTGGVKLIYNGILVDGKCNDSNLNKYIGSSRFSNETNSPAFVGYMYNKITYVSSRTIAEGNLYGEDIVYDNTNNTYSLTNTSTTIDNNHHYTCNNTTGTCSSVIYCYYKPNNYIYYVYVSGGKDSIFQVLEEMLRDENVNQKNSVMKNYLESWYQNNLIDYNSKIEDTIFCNDRTISDYGGWNPNGGDLTESLKFKSYTTEKYLNCTNELDQFSLSNSKALITYPIGLMTKSEVELLNEKKLTKSSQYSYLLSPIYNSYNYAYVSEFTPYGDVSPVATYSDYKYVRPVISLKSGTTYRMGDGSKNNPYIVE